MTKEFILILNHQLQVQIFLNWLQRPKLSRLNNGRLIDINFLCVVNELKTKLLIVLCTLFSFSSFVSAQTTNNYPFQVRKSVVMRNLQLGKAVYDDEMENKILLKESKRCMRNIKRHSFLRTDDISDELKKINTLESKSGITVQIAEHAAASGNYILKSSDSAIAEISIYKVLFNKNSDNVAILYYDYNNKKQFIAANKRIYPFDYDSEEIAMYNDDVYKLKIIYGSNDSDTLHFPYFVTDSIRIYKLNKHNDKPQEKEVLRFSDVRKISLPQLATPPTKPRQIPFLIHNGKFIYQLKGKVYINGKLLNERIKARSIIRYSIIKDKPSCLFYRNNEWHLSYDNTDYGRLGFDEILPLNSASYPCYPLTDLHFYARKGRKYYTVRIK